jgi:hypothetical protein
MLSIASKALSTINTLLSPTKTMINSSGMETYEARLATFQSAQVISKKRSSNIKGSKSAKWTISNPSPEQVYIFPQKTRLIY